MGNSSGKNKTHPLHEQERHSQPMRDYGRDDSDNQMYYEGDYDPRQDYDSGWYPNKNYGKPFKGENNPIAKRSCTDPLCFLLLLVFLGGWMVIAYFGVTEGDLEKVIYPTDTDGNVCGKGPLKDRKLLMMFDLTQCLNPAILVTGCPTPQMCVEKCPDEMYSPLAVLKFGGGSEDDIKTKMRPYCKLVDDSIFGSKSVATLIKEEICPPWWVKSTEVLGRCFPTVIDKESKEVIIDESGKEKNVSSEDLNTAAYRMSLFLNLRQFAERIFSDLKDTYWMIGLGLIGACILSFVWIVLMRFLASFMVWTSILLVFLGTTAGLGYSSYRLYWAYMDTDPEAQKNIFQLNWTPEIAEDFLKQRNTWLAFTIIAGIIFLIFLCLFIFLRQRIIIAIKLIEEGSHAVGQMFSSLFFPILPWLFQLIVFGFFLIVSLYLSSWGVQDYRVAIKNDENLPCAKFSACNNVSGSDSTPTPYRTNDTCDPATFSECSNACPEASCQFVKYTRNPDYTWMQFINIFALYWGVFFFAAYGEMVLAGVFSQWYWTLDKKKDLPNFALITAMWNTTVFHLGTLAFGSLIIAIIRLLITVLEYIEKKTKKFNNDLSRCILCMCKCCLWCLEKFMRFINKNAYIMCAVKSTNFCSSAKSAFDLIMRNLVRVAVLDRVVDFLLFLGKLVIVLATGATSFFAFGGYIPEIQDKIPNLNYFFTPILFIAVGSYMIASAFFGVYNMAVDTLFLCFLEDLERNDGSDVKPYYMAKSLKNALGLMEKQANEANYRQPYYHQ